MERVQSHLTGLIAEALAGLSEIKGVSIHGPLDPIARGPSITFTFSDLESHAVARMLASRYNVFVRSGHHCAQPAHEALGIRPSVRASMYLYNDHREVSQFVDAIHNISKYCVT
jgi:cysteine desulfurase/selenocysteine lyase